MSLLVKLTYFNRVFEKVLIEVSDKYIEKYVIKLLKHWGNKTFWISNRKQERTVNNNTPLPLKDIF